MKFEEIITHWAEDSIIDNNRLASESTKIPKMHAKYYRILIDEKLLILKLKERHDELLVVLEGFFAKTLTREELDHWKLVYTDKKVLRADFQKNIDVHPRMVELKMKIGIQNEKIDYLKDIIKLIHSLNFTIKNAIDFRRFEAGA